LTRPAAIRTSPEAQRTKKLGRLAHMKRGCSFVYQKKL
jgi:hypothetical protein